MKARSAFGMGLAAGAMLGVFGWLRMGAVNRIAPPAVPLRFIPVYAPPVVWGPVAVFPPARLNEEDLSGEYLVGANYRGSTLASVNFQRAHLEGADFRGARLSGVDLRSAHLGGARFDGARYDRGCRWPAGFDPEEHGATRLQEP